MYIGKRNWFKRTKEDLVEALANIDAKLTERYDVLTNQMKVAKKALSHEKDIQLGVAKLRSSATSPSGELTGVTERHAELATMTRKWNMVQENYPKIAAMPIMIKMEDKVSDIEADLEASRRFYSAVAKKFNSGIQTFPANVAASGMHLKRFPMFEAEDRKRKNVDLDF